MTPAKKAAYALTGIVSIKLNPASMGYYGVDDFIPVIQQAIAEAVAKEREKYLALAKEWRWCWAEGYQTGNQAIDACTNTRTITKEECASELEATARNDNPEGVK